MTSQRHHLLRAQQQQQQQQQECYTSQQKLPELGHGSSRPVICLIIGFDVQEAGQYRDPIRKT